MTREEAIKAIMTYFDENEEEFNRVIEEADAWDGVLGDDRKYSMDMLDDFYCGQPASKLLEDLTEDFRKNDNYFYFSIYGLESCDSPDYLYDYNTDSFAECLIDGDYNIDLPYEVEEIIDSIEDEEDEEDEEEEAEET